MSQASFMEEVDMASEDIFSGPVGESVPSSSVGFMHRRESIAESTTSFTYYDEEEHEGSDGWLEDGEQEEEAILDGEYEGEENGDSQTYGEEQAAEEQNGFADQDTDVEAQDSPSRRPIRRRKSSGLSRHSRRSLDTQRSNDPLLKRSDSQGSNTSATSGQGSKDRTSQKLYIQSEDLTIVIAGFTTSSLGMALYLTICILTGGLAYLVFRWLPKYKVKVTGRPSALKDCSWVVVEVRNVYGMRRMSR
jgi:cation-transporting ATPase 13A2